MNKNERITFDSISARHVDENGFMHVNRCHITKEQVVPYYGREIPGWRGLGLEAEKMYNVYRPGDEIAKSVSTFNGLPLLLEHYTESAENPQKLHRVGSLGTDAEWNPPYLDISLHVTDQAAIDAIEQGRFKELSSAYQYDPVIKTGTFNGTPYDIVMKNIRGNHVALVREGRAGPDVVVADAKPKTFFAWYKDHFAADSKDEIEFRQLDNNVTAAFHTDGTPANKTGAIAQEMKENGGKVQTGLDVKQAGPLKYSKTLKEYQAEAGGDHYEGARAFYRAELQGHSVKCKTDDKEIDAAFTGGGLKKLQFGLKNDPLKAELFPVIPDILATGKYEKLTAFKKREDGTSLYHTYTKRVYTSAGEKEAIVDVAERPNYDTPHAVYNLTREGTPNYETSQNKKASSTDSGLIPREDDAQNGQTVFDKNIPYFYEVVNIHIADEKAAHDGRKEHLTFDIWHRNYLAKDAAQRGNFSAWLDVRGLAVDGWITLSNRDASGTKHGGARVLLDDDGTIVYGLGGGHKGQTLGEALADIKADKSQGYLFTEVKKERRSPAAKAEREKISMRRKELKREAAEQEARLAEKARAEFEKRSAEMRAKREEEERARETPEVKAAREKREKREKLDKRLSDAWWTEREYKGRLNALNGQRRGDDRRERLLKEYLKNAKGDYATSLQSALKTIQRRREQHASLKQKLKEVRAEYKQLKKERDALGYDAKPENPTSFETWYRRHLAQDAAQRGNLGEWLKVRRIAIDFQPPLDSPEQADDNTEAADGGPGSGRHKEKPCVIRGVNDVSPQGKNIFTVRGFSSRQKLMNHWKNGRTHRSDYPDLKTPEEYEHAALALLESPCGGDIAGHADKDGVIIRYNQRTNDFAKGHPDKGVRTMFKPDDGEKYYSHEKTEDLRHGGRE